MRSCRQGHSPTYPMVSHEAGWHIHGGYYNMPVTDFKHYDFYKHNHHYWISCIDRWDWYFDGEKDIKRKWRRAIPYEMLNLNHDY